MGTHAGVAAGTQSSWWLRPLLTIHNAAELTNQLQWNLQWLSRKSEVCCYSSKLLFKIVSRWPPTSVFWEAAENSQLITNVNIQIACHPVLDEHANAGISSQTLPCFPHRSVTASSGLSKPLFSPAVVLWKSQIHLRMQWGTDYLKQHGWAVNRMANKICGSEAVSMPHQMGFYFHGFLCLPKNGVCIIFWVGLYL